MVSVLPAKISPWQAIGKSMSELGRNTPQLLENRFQTERGLGAIDKLQEQLAASGGDISKMLPAIARAYSLNPNLERSGLAQSALGFAKAGNIYGQPGQQGTAQSTGGGGSPGVGQSMQPTGGQGQPTPSVNPNQPPGVPVRESDWNMRTPDQMDAKARHDAQVTGDPSRYQQSLAEQQTLNKIAADYKGNLEGLARREGVSDVDLPDFMEVGEQFKSQNPDQWLKNTRAAYAPIKSSFDRLEKAFIPGLGSGLIGRDRDAYLKKITPDVQELVKMGREDQVRKFLASEWLSNTEVAEQIHPLDKRQEVALSRLPKGLFPPHKKATWSDVGKVFTEGKLPEHATSPFISYKEAKTKDPKALEVMQNTLSDFFLKNVNEDTSLSNLSNKIWEDKNYDWDQLRPAIEQAKKQGLKLNPRQQAELTDIGSQPPIQSLPDMFQDWWRVVQMHRGAK